MDGNLNQQLVQGGKSPSQDRLLRGPRLEGGGGPAPLAVYLLYEAVATEAVNCMLMFCL